ncbi:MAG: rhomboid family intramembrane serine protease [Candidatus Nanoarchaeia archaeon]|nr:rhomboid family intramembrane serine protease [Candidatus Nanoarchaeia archaeon]
MNRVIASLKRELAISRLKKDFYELFKGIFTWDLAIFAIFPIIITILALFPDFSANLRLNIHEWRWWQLLTSSFVHIDFEHFIKNILWFLTLFFCQIIIISRLNIKRDYLILFLPTVFLFPIISSIIQILVYPIKVPLLQDTMGSSGIISAFWGIGYFLVLFALSKKERVINKYSYYLAIGYICLSILVIYRSKAITIIIGLLFILFYLYKYLANIKIITRVLGEETHTNSAYSFILIFLFLLFFAAPYVLFPIKVSDNRGTVDLVVHYMGIIWGLSISYLYLNWKYKKRYLIAKHI